MFQPNFSEDIRPLTELKTKASSPVAQLHRSRRPMLLTRRGRGVAVLLDLEEYERLVERARFIEALEEGAAAVEAGDVHDHDEAEAILKTFDKSHG